MEGCYGEEEGKEEGQEKREEEGQEKGQEIRINPFPTHQVTNFSFKLEVSDGLHALTMIAQILPVLQIINLEL